MGIFIILVALLPNPFISNPVSKNVNVIFTGSKKKKKTAAHVILFYLINKHKHTMFYISKVQAHIFYTLALLTEGLKSRIEPGLNSTSLHLLYGVLFMRTFMRSVGQSYQLLHSYFQL